MENDYLIETIYNEDGTICDPPKNPLMDKWLQLYPPTPKPQFSQVCDGWSCIMGCSKCPYGENWKCPEEDREEYNKYLEEYGAYMRTHNPSMFK